MYILATIFFFLNVIGAAINFYFFFAEGELYSLITAAFNVGVALLLLTTIND